MTDKPFVLDVSSCPGLNSVEGWADWLTRAEASIPEIKSEEIHVIAAWVSYQEMFAMYGRWRLEAPHTPQQMRPATKAFLDLEWAIFTAILKANFEVETIAGLTVLMKIFSTVYGRDEEVTTAQYQECLAACTTMASKLTYKAMGVDYEESANAIPRTIH